MYTCKERDHEIYPDVIARVFKLLFGCPSKRCSVNKTKGNLILQLRASKFLKLQKVKIQELAEHVPKGHIPWSMTVYFRREKRWKICQNIERKLQKGRCPNSSLNEPKPPLKNFLYCSLFFSLKQITLCIFRNPSLSLFHFLFVAMSFGYAKKLSFVEEVGQVGMIEFFDSAHVL